MPKVNPSILAWARVTAGLSIDQAARKLAMSRERLLAMERGERQPSRATLAKAAEKYRRPLLAFYLPAPPSSSDLGEDFRTLPETPPPGAEAVVRALLRDVRARQGLVKAALEDAEEAEPLAFVGSAAMAEGVDAVVSAMRTTLGISLAEFRRQRTFENAFKLLRGGAEQAGIFVLLMGNLGTHHTNIDPRVFRGFALADPIAPFVVVNEKDSRAAWSFTLLHELVHLWLGQTGISGYDGAGEIEKFCDTAAARFLLDPSELSQLDDARSTNIVQIKADIETFAGLRKLSRKMVAYNLLRLGTIKSETYRRLCDLFDAERSALGGGAGAANYYVVRRHRIGPALVATVRRLLAGGELTTTQAGRVLGVKATTVPHLLEHDRAA